MKKIIVIHGPNLNLLGEREVEVYGDKSLDDINTIINSHAEAQNCEVSCFQFNSEGDIIDTLHKYRNEVDGFILNPGAFTHYSYAIRDAIASINPSVAEVHLSDINNREDFRKISVIKPVSAIQVLGKGINSYLEALDYLLKSG